MIVADTHVHVYPQYSLSSIVYNAERNIRAALGEKTENLEQIVLCVCDRTHFPTLRDSLRQLGHDLSSADDDLAQLFVFESRDIPVMLLESKQWVTREGFEILGLGSILRLPDGLRAAEFIRAIRAEGGTPVIPWSPGKWMFDRGRSLRAVLREFAPGDILLGDIYLRPAFTLPPAAMAWFRVEGGRVLYGSDPLPAKDEEKIAGRYVSVFNHAPVRTADAAALLFRSTKAFPLGERATMPIFIKRMFHALRAKQKASDLSS